MLDYSFKLDFQVRDYECDMQGIVNNSVYQNYLEHTRHEFLKTLGMDFAEVTRRKILLVVIRCELDYKYPLRSGDSFWVGLNLQQVSRIRFAFLQDVYRYPDNRLILNARIIGTAMNEKGRPKLPPEIAKALGQSSMNTNSLKD
ncbi:MAG: acyl-CoA thioesterase [Deltaproteobacteria bacterium]|nr:acyl-CoA thioesterase [Deltaproteobacteria bacterium]MBW1792841.1 acyl-CoA thioesterase [Deltaproteobacteria bacterium]MBW2330505.1 acyl-CoA thioesterase [Deltaproteobacteria bacterium]